ncbi:MAG TPA: hypothetical protein VN903_30605, partial [Polyangia bacterium]|nr:hypothetical protein [Polyangia bacterium]
VGVDCPSESVGEDCTADEVVVPAPAAVAPAPPAVAAPAATAAAQTPTAFATVSFRNDVGKKLRLVEAQFNLDGDKLPVVLTSAEPGKRYVILSGSVKPGQHIVSARLTYRGDRGLFTYMKGYKLHVRSDQVVTTPSNHTVNLTVVGSEARGMTVPLEKRVVITVEDGLGQHQSTSQK